MSTSKFRLQMNIWIAALQQQLRNRRFLCELEKEVWKTVITYLQWLVFFATNCISKKRFIFSCRWAATLSFNFLQTTNRLRSFNYYFIPKDELHKDRNNIFHYFLNDFYFKKSTFISRSPILATNSENNFQVTNFILHTSNKLPQYFPSVKSVWSYHLSFLRFFDFLKFRQRMEGYFKGRTFLFPESLATTSRC